MKGKSLRRDRKLVVWLSDLSRSQLEELAEELDGTMSEVVRHAVRELHRRTFLPLRKGSSHVEG